MARLIQRRIFVSGLVQGVGFRAFTVEMARGLGTMQGYVKNLQDGRVEVRVAGPEAQVLALVAACKQGPAHAQVVQLEVIEEEFDPSLPVFEFRRT